MVVLWNETDWVIKLPGSSAVCYIQAGAAEFTWSMRIAGLEMPAGPYRGLALITPVLHDRESFAALVPAIDSLYIERDFLLRILAIDHGSSTSIESIPLALGSDSCIVDVEVLHLDIDVGQQ